MGLSRRSFLAAAATLWMAPHDAVAQSTPPTYRVGLLATTPQSNPGAAHLWGALVEGLRDHGYTEGRNLILEYRHHPEGKADELPRIAAELVRLKVDVIVAGGSLTPHAAKSTTATIPIVIANHGDPVGSGLVTSLTRPGGNITGLSILNPELVGKQLELLKQALPKIAHVAVLWNPTSQTHARLLNEADMAARALAIRTQRVSASVLEDYERAFAGMGQRRTDAVLVLGDPIFWFHRARIAELALATNLPTMFVQREHVEAGGFMSYGANLRDNYRRAASYVDKILKGAKPADLPIEQPTKFELIINRKTARALGLTVPPSLLLRADYVIE